MFTRVLAILSATADRESARIDLALTRAGFLFIATIMLLPALALGPIATGPAMLQSQFGVSMFLMIFLAVRLGGDSVGDVRCGMLELLFLSDTKPWQWLLVRVAQMWIAFLSVWMIRAPLLFIVFSIILEGLVEVAIAVVNMTGILVCFHTVGVRVAI